MPEQLRIAVVGAGMAGMAAAYELARTPGVAVTLFEASSRLGGTVETVTIPSAFGDQPFVIECGPDSWVSEKPAARELAVELGLQEQLIYSNDTRRRTYLARGRELCPMPDGMRMMVPTRWAPLLESPLFSWQARLAYLREPRRAEELKAHALADDADESVFEFLRRHFGDEATETVAGPLLAGIFGGEIEKLSARAVLAPFVRMERECGSLVTAVMQRASQQEAAPLFTTLRSGLETLIDRMAACLPAGSTHLLSRVTALRPSPTTQPTGWLLSIARPPAAQIHNQPSVQLPVQPLGAQVSESGRQPSGKEAFDAEIFDAVILATPADVTRGLLAPLDREAAALLSMEATSAIVVALAFEPAVAAGLRIPRGFGFLVPPGQALRAEPGQPAGTCSLLAGTFMDQKFASRAPSGAVFLRGFFGGQAAPIMMDWPDADITESARAHFARLLGPLPAASHVVLRRWPHSLPQYAVGHLARMRRLEDRVDRMPGLRLVGNAYRGVGLSNLAEHGRAAARELAAWRSK